MGFLQDIPVTSVTATYHTATKKLILEAKGVAERYTSGITFNRLPFAGGLLFEVQGWVGPRALGSDPYDIHQSFDIELPNPVTPSNTVVINCDNPKSPLVVPIEFQPPLPTSYAVQPPGNKFTGVLPPNVEAEMKDLTVLYKLPFNITESIPTTQGSRVSVSFDKNYLVMAESTVEDGKIIWTFESLQTGHTQVGVAVSGGVAQFITKKTYDVRIEVLENTARPTDIAGLKTLAKKSVGGNGNGPEAILSFIGRVNIGFNLVKAVYPTARLYEVEATPIRPGTVTNPLDLSHLRVVCGLDNNQTAIITSTGWGEFGPVQMIPQPWLDDVQIKWPMSPELDIVDAALLIQKAGYRGPLSACTLRQPLYPGMTQPYYIFTTGGQFVAVGVFDKKVSLFSASGRNIETANVMATGGETRSEGLGAKFSEVAHGVQSKAQGILSAI